MNKRRHWLWRAVDQDGIMVQRRRDQHAAEQFLRRVLHGEHGAERRVVVTDKFASYAGYQARAADYRAQTTQTHCPVCKQLLAGHSEAKP
jgi:transposase-like protein